MKLFTSLVLFLLLSGSCLAEKDTLEYFAGILTEEQLSNIERRPAKLEMLPMVLTDSLDPEDLHDIDADNWRRRPREPREPIFDSPDEPIFDSPDRPRYPVISWLFNKIINLPIFSEIGLMISDFGRWVVLFLIWFLPVYLLRLRMVWPLDILMKIFDTFKELSKNTKKPFEE